MNIQLFYETAKFKALSTIIQVPPFFFYQKVLTLEQEKTWQFLGPFHKTQLKC